MLRISSVFEDGRPVLRLEGRLAGLWVHEAETQWTAALAKAGDATVTVDLRDVVSVDAEGKELLSRMGRDGASLVVAGCAMRAFVDELAVVGKDVSGDS